MNILVTGGTGFVGRWLQRTQPYGVSVRYLNKFGYENSRWEWYDWDAVIHAANVSPLHVIHSKKTRLMYISSGAVYKCVGEYSDNKRKWEAQCPDDAVIARLFTFVGEGLKNKYAITKFIEAAKNGNPPQVWGSGSTVRSYLHGEDMGRWLWKMLLEGDGAYDVGSEIRYSMLELAELVSEVYGVPYEILFDDYPESTYVPDTTRAKALGCVETVGLREAIERTKHESS